MEREGKKEQLFSAETWQVQDLSQVIKVNILNDDHEKNPNSGAFYKNTWPIILKIVKVIKTRKVWETVIGMRSLRRYDD